MRRVCCTCCCLLHPTKYLACKCKFISAFTYTRAIKLTLVLVENQHSRGLVPFSSMVPASLPSPFSTSHPLPALPFALRFVRVKKE